MWLIKAHTSQEAPSSTSGSSSLGQIGKNDENKENISGKEILKYACNFIEEASDIVAGRIILVELKNNQKLINFYTDNGFSLLDNNTKNEENLLQMIKIFIYLTSILIMCIIVIKSIILLEWRFLWQQ